MTPTTVFLHGIECLTAELETMLRANAMPIAKIITADSHGASQTLRDEMEVRGRRYVAVVDARCRLQPGWLDMLAGQAGQSEEIGAVTFGEPDLRLCADARCTLLSLRNFPAHLRLDAALPIDAALADFLTRGAGAGAFTFGVPQGANVLPASAIDDAPWRERATVENALRAGLKHRSGLVSIVMLSWNAVQFTKIALDSIRAHTAGDYEIIIVDNGSGPETVEWLRTLHDVRVIYNAENRGYAGGNNQALAAARGEYVVLLNNDVIVTEGWLDDLLGAFERIPGLGISAPRSNRIAGDQIVADAAYSDVPEMHAFARRRRAEFRAQGYLTDRAIGLCLCLDRRMIEEIGGLDERYGAGNFEDDDFCLRARAAGYRIWVCNDVFIHHFGSQTFAANKIDWSATMRGNWSKFAQKWGYPPEYPDHGYLPAEAIARGFVRERHYVALQSLSPA
jgi:GT2 family glycosyltransferase